MGLKEFLEKRMVVNCDNQHYGFNAFGYNRIDYAECYF